MQRFPSESLKRNEVLSTKREKERRSKSRTSYIAMMVVAPLEAFLCEVERWIAEKLIKFMKLELENKAKYILNRLAC